MPNRTGKTKTALNLRQGPGTDQAVVTTLPPNAPFELLEAQGTWLKVATADSQGYIHRHYVSLDPPPPESLQPPPAQAGRTTTRLNLRQGPGVHHDVIMTLPRQTPLTVLGEQGPWLRVQTTGETGFVHGDFVVLETPPSELPPVPPPAQAGHTRTHLNLRLGPGTQFEIRRTLPPQTPLSILGSQEEWLHVAADGENGYVHRDFVVLDKPSEPEPELEPEPEPEAIKTGKTSVNLNFRTGPGTGHDVIRVLPRGTAVSVLEETGEWFHIRVNGDEGYVHRNFVVLDTEGAPDDFLDPQPDPQQPSDPQVPPLPDAPLEPAERERLRISDDAPWSEQRIASTWNRYGGLLATLSLRLRIDPGVALAVLVAESGGTGFGADGRMIIRFENHVFYNRWGKFHQEKYERHFRFDSSRRWLGHEFRPAPGHPWRKFHGRQQTEWEVFNFARKLSETAAKLSISMGSPQIMGFNYATLGYESVHQMFSAFSASEAHQIIGFFDFVQGPTVQSRRIIALQRLDFNDFAALYNGPGQAAVYSSIISGVYETFKRMRKS